MVFTANFEGTCFTTLLAKREGFAGMLHASQCLNVRRAYVNKRITNSNAELLILSSELLVQFLEGIQNSSNLPLRITKKIYEQSIALDFEQMTATALHSNDSRNGIKS